MNETSYVNLCIIIDLFYETCVLNSHFTQKIFLDVKKLTSPALFVFFIII